MLSKLIQPAVFDLRSLGLLRIILGLTLAYDIVFFRLGLLDILYSVDGVTPPDSIAHITPFVRFNIISAFPSDQGLTIFFYLMIISALLFAAGVLVRLTGLICFLGFASILMRNGLAYGGPEQVLLASLFFCLFLPVSERFALRFEKWGLGEPRAESNLYQSGAATLYAVQISLIYLVTAVLKDGSRYADGTALSHALFEDLYVRQPFAGWLASQGSLTETISLSVVPFEYVLPLLVISPVMNSMCRFVSTLLILGLHWSIFPFITVGHFPVAMTCLAVFLIPSFVWDGFEDLLSGPFGEVNRYPLSLFSKVALTFCFSIILFQNFNSVTSGLRLNQSDLVDVMTRFPLFEQGWGMYAPNPTERPGWIELIGKTQSGELIDLRTKLPAKKDSPNIEGYFIVPLQGLAWGIANDKLGKLAFLGERWVRYEIAEWDKLHPDNPIVRAEVLIFRRTISHPSLEVSIEKSSLVVVNPKGSRAMPATEVEASM